MMFVFFGIIDKKIEFFCYCFEEMDRQGFGIFCVLEYFMKFYKFLIGIDERNKLFHGFVGIFIVFGFKKERGPIEFDALKGHIFQSGCYCFDGVGSNFKVSYMAKVRQNKDIILIKFKNFQRWDLINFFWDFLNGILVHHQFLQMAKS